MLGGVLPAADEGPCPTGNARRTTYVVELRVGRWALHRVLASPMQGLCLPGQAAPSFAAGVTIAGAAEAAEPLPQPKVGQCPSGYRESGGYCAPTSDRAPAAVPKRGQCPSNWMQSGAYCVLKDPLLTGWSLVRIRPGEPNQIKYLGQLSDFG
jgi:hypothetical protein